jgi:hypothetical protein
MFDKDYPANNSPASAAGMRQQLNALNAIVPIGIVVPWFKDTPGVPPLPANYLECNGQTVADPTSPLDGIALPDLNGAGHFVRGGNTSGLVGGSDVFAITTVDFTGSGTSVNVPTTDYSPGASPIPLHTTAVWVMRIK